MKYQINYKSDFPIRLLYGFLKTETDEYQIPTAFPAKTDWGEVIPNEDFNIEFGSKIDLELGWIALESYQTYYFRGEIPIPVEIIKSELFTLLIGLGNKGEIALWLITENKSFLVLYSHGVNITDKITDDMISQAHILDVQGKHIKSIVELCDKDILRFRAPSKSIPKIIDCIDNRMKQYVYRYDVVINQSAEELVINDCLFDGTYDKTLRNELQSYHGGGKVRKLLVQWIEKNHEDIDKYSVFYWMDEIEITKIFDRFYGVHPETKTDFIIRIDSINNKYELSLYRQGLKEPVVIPESAYQLIVFKNKFEYYRSENYNQPRGAWIW